MATNYKGSMEELASRVELYKRNPTLIQRAVLDYLSDVTNGEIEVVDVTNPFVFLLEASAVNTAAAINQNNINLRAQYAALAIEDKDIFRHLSDKELIGRYANPSSVDFIFMMTLDDLKKNMIRVEDEKLSKLVIPRDTEINVDTVTYTFTYPIVISLHDTGGLSVTYDADKQSPVDTITTNNIVATLQNSPSGVKMLYFTIKVKQMAIKKQEFTVEAKSIFRKTIAITDQFYYARAFMKSNSTNGQWQEIKTTHTDQVYDLKTPTVCFKVMTDIVEVYVPHVYIVNGLIGSSIRIDIYTTKGDYSVNYKDHQLSAFTYTLRNIDPADDSIFTTTTNNLSMQVFSTDVNVGGSNAVDFEKLRERTIYHANGDIETPINHAQVDTKFEDNGFDLVKHIDVITDRVFLATRNLPAPENKKLLTPINVSIGTTVIDTDTLEESKFAIRNNNRLTLLPGNLYSNNGGIISIVPVNEVEAIKRKVGSELVQYVNSNNFLYTPFYYVLDFNNREFDLRAYDLDNPTREEINFISQNDSIQMPVNSNEIIWLKTSSGYELYVKTTSGNFYKNASIGEVGMQLGFFPDGESHMAYINGVLYSTNPDDGERVWKFELNTTHDLNEQNCLSITNAKMFVDEPLTTWIPLDTKLYLMHHTSSITDIYRVDSADSMLGKFLIDSASRIITLESMDVKLGVSLDNLWKRSRTIPTGQTYQRYELDEPLLYESDVYETDSSGIVMSVVDGKLTYNVIHSAGSQVLHDGEVVYKHKAGDVVLDIDGNPLTVGEIRNVRELDIMFLDGNLFFVTDDSMAAYRRQVVDIIVDWVIDDIELINKETLDETSVYFYPKSTLGKVAVYLSNDADAIMDAQQKFSLDMYVSKAIYDSKDVRELIKNTAITVIDSFIGKEEVNMDEISDALRAKVDSGIKSFKLYGLGGEKDYQIVKIKNLQNSLCIAKRLAVQADGTYIVEDDVTVNFIRY